MMNNKFENQRTYLHPVTWFVRSTVCYKYAILHTIRQLNC